MKYLVIALFLSVFYLPSRAQNSSRDSLNMDSLQSLELQLQGLSREFINSDDERSRVSSAYHFVKTLIKAFRIRGSYKYPFDSVKSVSILKSPDNVFRIFTWHLRLDNGLYRCYGAIQLNPDKPYLNGKQIPADGKPYFPLIDRSDSIANPADTTVGPEMWYGALYYHIIMRKVKKQTYYFLFGYDGFKKGTDKKLIDVLTFIDGKPYFGAPFFKVGTKIQSRFILEYNEEGNVSLRYLPKDDIITFDHLLTPDDRDVNLADLALPDGTYDYFIWKEDLWLKQDLLFQTKKKLKK